MRHTAVTFFGKYARQGSRNKVGNDKTLPTSNSCHTRFISLHQAARDGLEDDVRNSVKPGDAAVDDLDASGFTPMHYAARNGHAGVLKYLLGCGADANVKCSEEQTALHLAAKNGKADCTAALLEHSANVGLLDSKGKTALHLAARRGRVDVVEVMLKLSVPVDLRNAQNMTPLHEACLSGCPALCTLLISCGANIGSTDMNLRTPLMLASAEGFTDIMQLLLGEMFKRPASESWSYLNAQDDEGATALHAAVHNGCLQAVRYLVAVNAVVDIRKHADETSLHLAASGSSPEILDCLLGNGSDIGARDDLGRTPLHRSSLLNKLDCARLLVKKGADLAVRDAAMMTPLHCAASRAQLYTIRYLTGKNSDIMSKDNMLRTPLHLAVLALSEDCVMCLLSVAKQQGLTADLLSSVDDSGQTAAHYAAKLGNLACLSLLIMMGARLTIKDDEEKSALHLAAQHGHTECIDALLKASTSEVNDADWDGRTPLMLAIVHGHADAVRLLLGAGGDVLAKDHRDDNRQTPLSLACAGTSPQIASLLLAENASVSATDSYRNTPLHIACAKNRAEIVQVLLDHRASLSARNVDFKTPLSVAIDYGSKDAAMVIAQHSSWLAAMDAVDRNGFTPMKILIQKMPEVAKVIMDKCVVQKRTQYGELYETTYNFVYIDPPPDSSCCKDGKHWFVTTIFRYNRTELAWHPLVQQSINVKWSKFGRAYHLVEMVLYMAFVINLAVFTQLSIKESMTQFNETDGCSAKGIITNTTELNITALSSYLVYGIENSTSLTAESLSSGLNHIIFSNETNTNNATTQDNDTPLGVADTYSYTAQLFLNAYILLQLMHIIKVKHRFFRNIRGWLITLITVTAFLFLRKPSQLCTQHWRLAWMSNLMSSLFVCQYLKSFQGIGVLVLTFQLVIRSIVKILPIMFVILWAFGLTFAIILARNASFTPNVSIQTTLSMAVGELQFEDRIVNGGQQLLSFDASVVMVIFVFAVPIALMNMTIGVAVSDVEKLLALSAFWQLEHKVNSIHSHEVGTQLWMMRRLYVDKITVRTQHESGCRSKLTMKGKQADRLVK